MSAYTPGPWEVDGTEWGCVRRAKTGDGITYDIFNVDDARLIAAAPDLLAALKAIVHDGMVHWSTVIKDQTLAAIAKAEGRS